MRAINHALTGSVIGLTVSNPVVAIPLAFASHFVCDAIPHYGSSDLSNAALASRRFAVLLAVDALLCLSLVLILGTARPFNWSLAAVCAFIASLPDFAFLPGYLRVKQGKTFLSNKASLFVSFAKNIQWFERPIGAVVEVVWFLAGVSIVITYL